MSGQMPAVSTSEASMVMKLIRASACQVFGSGSKGDWTGCREPQTGPDLAKSTATLIEMNQDRALASTRYFGRVN